LIEYNDLNNKLFDKLKNEAGTKSATTKIKMAKKFI
jgi:hypothetical protein